MSVEPLPFRPGDWVAEKNSHSQIARVRDVYRDGEDVLLDLVLYSVKGVRVGRASPALGGPRGYEPACDSGSWERIKKPDFPVEVRWIPQDDGSRRMGYYAGPALPPAEYLPRQKTSYSQPKKDAYREALEAIANGHNDPRQLASQVLKDEG